MDLSKMSKEELLKRMIGYYGDLTFFNHSVIKMNVTSLTLVTRPGVGKRIVVDSFKFTSEGTVCVPTIKWKASASSEQFLCIDQYRLYDTCIIADKVNWELPENTSVIVGIPQTVTAWCCFSGYIEDV